MKIRLSPSRPPNMKQNDRRRALLTNDLGLTYTLPYPPIASTPDWLANKGGRR